MSKNLVIVESPAKAKTIEKFLGKDYKVKSCYGHVRDLPGDKLSVDVEKGFEPQYVIPDDKKPVIKDLKKEAKQAETIWLATDEDREGEAISWHLIEALDLDPEKTKRIVFHEITKSAIQNAIKNPRRIDENLVSAQQARRVLDRLVGFELSPILWRKIKPALSAGRVQSVAVRLVVEREREVNKFQPDNFFKVSAIFDIPGKGTVLHAELPKKFKTREEAQKFLEDCKVAEFSISDIQVKPSKKKPAPPFTTSTLQQEAARKLSFSVSRTMMLAQKLYEAGHITYMRTDSVNISETAIKEAEEAINQNYGNKYAKPRRFSTQAKGAQEAHECIRPTSMTSDSVKADQGAQKLYDLIYKRTLASQMAEAELEKTTAYIGLSNNDNKFTASGEVIKFDGFLKVYLESRDDEEEDDKSDDKLLPPLEKGQTLTLKSAQAIERFTRPPARYTEASLVKKLEEMGIGRPSTYAPTISTIMKRGYVLKESREGNKRQYILISLKNNEIKETKPTETYGTEKNKLFPSDVGMVVNDFLMQFFDDVMDFNFTAKVEEQFDKIAEGKKEWQKMISSFYDPFHKAVETTLKESKKFKGEKELGTHPETSRPLVAKIGKYGPFVQMGDREDEEKPRFAKLRPGQLIENLTHEDAVKLFELPKEVGQFEDKPMTVNIGRFGPYVFHDNTFYSIPAEEDPYELGKDRAIEIIKDGRERERQRRINTFEHDDKELKVLRGKFGPYISHKGKNYRVPKETDPETLSKEDCLKIIEEKQTKSNSSSKSGAKKQTKSKTTGAKKGGAKKAGSNSTASKKSGTAKKSGSKATKKTS